MVLSDKKKRISAVSHKDEFTFCKTQTLWDVLLFAEAEIIIILLLDD